MRYCFLTLLLAGSLNATIAKADTVQGTVVPITPLSQFLQLEMTINEATTSFEITGPGHSWFAFGFDTTTMQGYSLIVQGTNGDRTVVEQNLVGRGRPGEPQELQNISLTDVYYDPVANLTTVTVERLSNTGDPEDPIFSTAMTTLPLIWAYDPLATPAEPSPDLSGHDNNGRGFASITFSAVPEPTTVAIALVGILGFAACRFRTGIA